MRLLVCLNDVIIQNILEIHHPGAISQHLSIVCNTFFLASHDSEQVIVLKWTIPRLGEHERQYS